MKTRNPIRVTMKVAEIQRLEYLLFVGTRICDIMKEFKCSRTKITNNMKLLGLEKASNKFENKKVIMQINIPRKHYLHAEKLFKQVVRDIYSVDKAQYKNDVFNITLT